jgi:thiopurine S-methyltransferase
MEEAFWLDRWDRNQIGFHQSEVNPDLRRYWPGLGLSADEPVFVPLCGKSRDLAWLRARGHTVRAVELSRRAVAAFFAESGLEPRWSRTGPFEVAEADGVRILCGDFFDLTAADLAGTRGVYDRAALIALPPDVRERYAARMAEIVPPGARMLLLTIEYPQERMEGPPFSVPRAEVERLYGPLGEVRLLERYPLSAQEPPFAGRGIEVAHGCVFDVTLGR